MHQVRAWVSRTSRIYKQKFIGRTTAYGTPDVNFPHVINNNTEPSLRKARVRVGRQVWPVPPPTNSGPGTEFWSTSKRPPPGRLLAKTSPAPPPLTLEPYTDQPSRGQSFTRASSLTETALNSFNNGTGGNSSSPPLQRKAIRKCQGKPPGHKPAHKIQSSVCKVSPAQGHTAGNVRARMRAWEMGKINPDLSFRAQTRSHFFREAFPDPSPGSHCTVPRPSDYATQFATKPKLVECNMGYLSPYWAAGSTKGGRHLEMPSIQPRTLHTIGRQ